ncbi:MAG: magnesium transporter CorA family protein [Spirochaetales bacterium]|nr:magnesium transporter CorA family protein [Spirochaetales bacterium]
MITIWKQIENSIRKTAVVEKYAWLVVEEPTDFEIHSLKVDYKIPEDFIQDILDPDERPRYEIDNGNKLIIFRVPMEVPGQQPPFQTLPLGVVIQENIIITLCGKKLDFLRLVQDAPVKDYSLSRPSSFLLHLVHRSAIHFLRFLKAIQKQTAVIEQELQGSVKNNELIKLLFMEKALVYFTTSLRSNELLMEKLQKTIFKNLSEDDLDLLEDALTENKQAIDMANIHSNILSGMMDAFASVISNNLNMVMKRLTVISITLMIPTLLASLYGMNLDFLPFSTHPLAFTGIVGVSLFGSIIGGFFFARNPRIRKKTGVFTRRV